MHTDHSGFPPALQRGTPFCQSSSQSSNCGFQMVGVYVEVGNSHLCPVTGRCCCSCSFPTFLYLLRASCGWEHPFGWDRSKRDFRVRGCELAKGAPVKTTRGTAAWRDRFPPANYSEKQRTCRVLCCTTPEYFQTSYSFIPSLALFKSKTDQQKASHRFGGHSCLCHWPEEAQGPDSLLEKRRPGQSGCGLHLTGARVSAPGPGHT